MGLLAGCDAPAARPLVDGQGRGQESKLTQLQVWEESDGTLILTLRADEATIEPTTKRARLVRPVVRFDAPGEGLRSAELRASVGHLDAPATLVFSGPSRGQTLRLEGPVTLRDADGRRVTSARAEYQLEARRLVLPEATLAEIPRGRARAGRAVVDLAAESLVLEGGVDAELQP